jgi:molybdopterin-guanine dinucleotide biosynthesis protein A
MEITPYILIGGRSRRFGRDKALYKFAGETLARRAVNVVETALGDVEARFVAARVDQFPQLSERRTIADVYPGRGAVGAVHAALTDAKTEWIFVMACDLPFITAEFIGLMRSEIVVDIEAVVPADREGRIQPLCGFYSVEACREVFEVGANGSGKTPSLLGLISGFRSRTLGFDEYRSLPGAERILQNVNTRDDLAGIE